MTRKDVQIVEFPTGRLVRQAEMMGRRWKPLGAVCAGITSTTWPSDRWRRRSRRARSMRCTCRAAPVELSETTGKFNPSRLSRYPDWTLQVAHSCRHHCRLMREAPSSSSFMKGMIKVGRWPTSTRRRAAILDKQTFYRTSRHLRGIKPSIWCPPVAQNLVSVESQGLHAEPQYIKNDSREGVAAPEFLEKRRGAPRAAVEEVTTPSCQRPRSAEFRQRIG